jgi:hypothetical protein
VRQSGAEMSAPSPPPGWYPDPSGAPHQRYWDGWQFIAGGVPSPPPPGWYPDPSGAPGQRYWDGWQFIAGGVPSPPPPGWPQGQSPNANPYHRGSVITALAASAGVIVGSLGPWVHVMLFSVGGLDFGNWGIATLILGSVSGVALLNELYWLRGPATPRWAVPVAWAAAVAGLACVTDAVMNIVRLMTIPKGNFLGASIGPEVGWGLWLLVFAAASLAVASTIVALQVAKRLNLNWPPVPTSWTNGWRWGAIVASAVIVISAIVYASVNPWRGEENSAQPPGLPSFPNPFGSETSTSATPTPTVSAGQEVRVGGLAFIVTRVTRQQSVGDPDDIFHFNADGIYEIIYYTVRNVGNDSGSVDSMSQKLFIDGHKYDSDMMASENADRRAKNSTSLNPGLSADLVVAFDIPPDSAKGQLEVHTSRFSEGGARIDLANAPS